jgi:hypothetical protein
MAEPFIVFCPKCARDFSEPKGRGYCKIFKSVCPWCRLEVDARDAALAEEKMLDRSEDCEAAN